MSSVKKSVQLDKQRDGGKEEAKDPGSSHKVSLQASKH